MRFILLAAVASLLWSSAASAQVLQFEAKMGPDGKVELVPKGPTDDSGKNAGPAKAENIYLWTNPTGAVKGIYTSQAEALTQNLSAGDTVKALATAPQMTTSVSDWSGTYFRDIAQEAARQLLQSARDAACKLDPKPDTITPTVAVSFSAMAGGSLSVSATWQTKTLCKAP